MFHHKFNYLIFATHHSICEMMFQDGDTRATIKLKMNSLSHLQINHDIFPLLASLNIKTHDAICSKTSKEGTAFMNLTDKFLHCSSRGNEYIFIPYQCDSIISS